MGGVCLERMAQLIQSRVYIRRHGRMTRAQARALQTLLGRYQVPMATTEMPWSTVFGREAPLVLEVGFGMGHALLATAQRHPDECVTHRQCSTIVHSTRSMPRAQKWAKVATVRVHA